jgi:preprotein translocase subunit YajC
MTMAFASPVMLGFAPPQAPPGQESTMPPWASLVPFLLLFAVMYFLLILPQQRKAKQHTLLIKSLKAGDKVVTSSGIVGVVVSLRDHQVTIRSEDTKLEILKSAVQDVLERKA